MRWSRAVCARAAITKSGSIKAPRGVTPRAVVGLYVVPRAVLPPMLRLVEPPRFVIEPHERAVLPPPLAVLPPPLAEPRAPSGPGSIPSKPSMPSFGTMPGSSCSAAASASSSLLRSAAAHLRSNAYRTCSSNPMKHSVAINGLQYCCQAYDVTFDSVS